MHEGIEPPAGRPCNLSHVMATTQPLPINAWFKHADGSCLAAFAEQAYNLQALKHHIFCVVRTHVM